MKQFSLLIVFALLFKITNAQIPNSGFELWTNFQPDYWITNSCPFCDPPWESYIVRQDSDTYNGSFNADFYGNGVFKPFAYTKFPVTYRPIKLKFYTKVSFAPCVNDTGYAGDTVAAKIELLSQGAVVDSGYWSYSGLSISTYQLVEIPLTHSPTLFDSCRIYIEGGKVFGGCGTIAEATEFKVDQLELIVDSSGCTTSFGYNKHIDIVNFSGFSSQDTVASWMWDFGDGQIDSSQNPVHIFTPDGWYNVCLTVTALDSGLTCVAATCDSVYITHGCIDSSLICPTGSLCCDAPLFQPVCGCDSVTYDNACIASYWHGVTSYTEGACPVVDTNICKASITYTIHSDTVDFSGTSNLALPVSWAWHFGDGQSENNMTAQHVYAHPGWYHACFTITGQDSAGINCTATTCDSLYISDGCIDSSLICPTGSLCCDAPIIEPVCGCDNVTYDNGCQATSWYGVINYTPGPCITSVRELKSKVSVSLLPNPASEKIIINVELPEHGTVMVRMRNVLGVLVNEFNSIEQQGFHYSQEIELTDLPNEIYFVEILLDKEIIAVKKLIKE